MITALTTALPQIELGSAVAGLAAVALLALLAEREIASAAGGRYQGVAQSLLISILPLLVVFAVLVSSRLLRFP
jgi:hypothetical protein